jgi:AcrR family transcriptional regulator
VHQPRTPTRQRLLDAAVEVVARNGYLGATVAQIIAKAGASRSTFYDIFADKDDCIREATKAIGDRVTAAVDIQMRASDAKHIAPGLAEVLLRFAHEHPTQARVLFSELLSGGAQVRDERDTLIGNLSAIVEDAWRRRSGQTPTHDLPTSVLVGGIFRLLSFRMLRGASGLHDLQPAVLAWIDSYTLDEGKPRWQDAAALEALGVPALAPVKPIRPPRPLPKGRQHLLASEIARNRHDRLLHATAESVAQKGYAAVTVADIVRTAQVSRDVFYNQFHDKEKAVIEAMQVAFERSMTAGVGAFFTATEWPLQLWESGRALSEYYAADPNFVYLTFVESYAAGHTAVEIVEHRTKAFMVLLEQGYQHRPEAQALPRTISEIIAFATFELAYQEIRQKRPPEQLSRLLPQLAYINLAPFMGAHDATTFVQQKLAELT